MKILSTVLGLAVFFAAHAAIAGAGDLREKQLYGRFLANGKLRCPKGTERQVQDSPYGVEESCVTRKGIRHGYYLRWHTDGDAWAVLGNFHSGTKVGTWITFAPDGRQRSSVTFKKKRKKARKVKRRRNADFVASR